MNTIRAVPFVVFLTCLPLFWLLHAHGICLSDTAAQCSMIPLFTYVSVLQMFVIRLSDIPFFQPSGYSPSGNFTDGKWPTAVPQGCSEATVASVNSDGIACGGGPIGYNANNGGWLRAGTFDKGITNQSSIDLSPAVNKALGWVYPSSGLINVNVSALP